MTTPSNTTAPWELSAAQDRLADAIATIGPEGEANSFLMTFLDMTLTFDDEQETSTLVVPGGRHITNRNGGIQGGVIAFAIDIGMGRLCARYLSPGVTLDMNLRFLGQCTGLARCRSSFVRKGGRVMVVTTDVTDIDGRLVATATAAFYRRPDRQASVQERAPEA